MNKKANNLEEKELLKRVEDLIDSKNANQKYTNSFLGFCSRLFSVRPKTDADFQLSLEQELLKKHPACLEEEVESCRVNKINKLNNKILKLITITRKEFVAMKNIKRFALGGIPVIAIALVFVFTMLIQPQMQTANAIDVMENDPQVQAVIEDFSLQVQDVEIRDNMAYILLDVEEYVAKTKTEDSLEVTIIVDLNTDTVYKTVVRDGEAEYEMRNIDDFRDEYKKHLDKQEK